MNLIISKNGKIIKNTKKINFGLERKLPTIIYLGGNTANSIEQVIKGEGLMKSLLGDDALMGKYDILSVGYSKEIVFSYGHLSGGRGIYHEHSGWDYGEKTLAANLDELYDVILKPILYNKEGGIRSHDEIIYDLSKMVFVSHCGGTCVLNSIINRFISELEQREVKAKDILKIAKHLSSVNYSPYELVPDEVTSVNICPIAEPANEISWTREFSAYRKGNTYYSDSSGVTAYCSYDENFDEWIWNEYKVLELLKQKESLMAHNDNRYSVMLSPLSDSSLARTTDDHSITSLVYSSFRPEQNPRTYEYATKVKDVIGNIIAALSNPRKLKSHGKDSKKDVILNNLKSISVDTLSNQKGL